MRTRLALSALTAATALSLYGIVRVPLEETGLERMKSGFGTAKPGKSIDGNALSVGGAKYACGVGTHSPGSHRIAAACNALSFSAMVGVDDETGGRGSVVFRVIADGKAVAEVKAKGGEAAKPIQVDLSGARRVVLEVADAGDGNYYDHADWCDAVFTFKDGTKPLSAAEMTRQLGILTPKGDGSPRINAPARYGARPGRPVIFKVPVTGERTTVPGSAPISIEVSMAVVTSVRQTCSASASSHEPFFCLAFTRMRCSAAVFS